MQDSEHRDTAPPAQPSRLATETVVLASASATRAALLAGAGVAFEAVPAALDEDEVKRSLRAEGGDGAVLAETLAVLKARAVSRRRPGRLVIAADQVLLCGERILDKPADMAAAREQLVLLRGRAHEQLSCVAVVRDGERLWHHLARARLVVRRFSDAFLEAYLAQAGEGARVGPGAYRLEGLGAQLFARIDGDYFTILGLPLIPLLDYLRSQRVLRT